MRISDWSSDVCSSDLLRAQRPLLLVVIWVRKRKAGPPDVARLAEIASDLSKIACNCAYCRAYGLAGRGGTTMTWGARGVGLAPPHLAEQAVEIFSIVTFAMFDTSGIPGAPRKRRVD